MAVEILVVEDDDEIAQMVTLFLERDGFVCDRVANGLDAVQRFRQHPVPLIILDLMLPGLDGLEVCARIRQSEGGKEPYILMLTAKGEELDRIIGLSTGADDYIVKPFSPRELVARVRALLRRSLRGPVDNNSQAIATKHFRVDRDRRVAERDGVELDLTNLEFSLLSAFVGSPQRVWTRSQLIEKLWGDDFFGDERVVDTHVARLRKKIEPDTSQPTFIKTAIGVGYKFDDERA
ncbi:MAG: response regulator transcription factor [Cyanobacteria bacterium P01_D01_bin.123]